MITAIIVVVALIAIAFLFYILGKISRRIYKKIDEYNQQAVACTDLEGLTNIRLNLVEWATNECWHPEFRHAANNALSYIDGKMQVLRQISVRR